MSLLLRRVQLQNPKEPRISNHSILVAKLVGADLLVILSDMDGLYDKDPHKYKDAKFISKITEISEDILNMADGAGTSRGTGGLVTKLSAAKICMEAGTDMVISNGQRPEDIYDIVDGKEVGTRFVSKAVK